MLSKNLKLSSTSVAGVTPFYYMMFGYSAKEAVNGIINLLPIDHTIGFIETVEHIHETILALSNAEEATKIPQEDLELLTNEDIYRFFIEAVDKGFTLWVDQLTDIKMKNLESFVDVDFRVGTATISSLLKMTAPDMEKRMSNELAPYNHNVQGESASLEIIKYVDNCTKFIEEIKAGIVVVDRKISVQEKASKGVETSYVNSLMSSIINETLIVDHTVLNNDPQYMRRVRNTLAEFSLDTKIVLHQNVLKGKDEVNRTLSKKQYNNSTLVSLERKKNTFERNVVTLNSKLESIRVETATDVFYF